MEAQKRHLLLIGEHDKGLGMPFHPSTVSGRRLRAMTAALGDRVTVTLENMATPEDGVLAPAHLDHLRSIARRADAVVLLGAFVQRALRPLFPEAVLLPHPGARRPIDLQTLREGLIKIAHTAPHAPK